MVQEDYRDSTVTVLEQFMYSSGMVQGQYRNSQGTVQVQHKKSTGTAQEDYSTLVEVFSPGLALEVPIVVSRSAASCGASYLWRHSTLLYSAIQ